MLADQRRVQELSNDLGEDKVHLKEPILQQQKPRMKICNSTIQESFDTVRSLPNTDTLQQTCDYNMT